jgi:hypothetical protein
MTVRVLAAAALLGFATVSVAQGPPGSTPLKTGSATLLLDGKKVTFDKVQGYVLESAGSLVVPSLVFGPTGGDNLQVSVLVKGPGPVDLAQPYGNGIAFRKGGTFFQNEKGKPGCTLTVTRITRTEIEGTAECPALKELNGSRTLSVTGVKFSAKGG